MVRFDASFDAALLLEAVDVERSCCPFFRLEPLVEGRQLIVSVATPEQDPGLGGGAAPPSVGHTSPLRD
jgi:hypothetical protein